MPASEGEIGVFGVGIGNRFPISVFLEQLTPTPHHSFSWPSLPLFSLLSQSPVVKITKCHNIAAILSAELRRCARLMPLRNNNLILNCILAPCGRYRNEKSCRQYIQFFKKRKSLKEAMKVGLWCLVGRERGKESGQRKTACTGKERNDKKSMR